MHGEIMRAQGAGAAAARMQREHAQSSMASNSTSAHCASPPRYVRALASNRAAATVSATAMKLGCIARTLLTAEVLAAQMTACHTFALKQPTPSVPILLHLCDSKNFPK
jgi:hypothetical protein